MEQDLKELLEQLRTKTIEKEEGIPGVTILIREGAIDPKTGERWTPKVYVNIDEILGASKK